MREGVDHEDVDALGEKLLDRFEIPAGGVRRGHLAPQGACPSVHTRKLLDHEFTTKAGARRKSPRFRRLSPSRLQAPRVPNQRLGGGPGSSDGSAEPGA